LHRSQAEGVVVKGVRPRVLSVSTAVILTCLVYAPWLVTSSHPNPSPSPNRPDTRLSPADFHNIDRTGLSSDTESATEDDPNDHELPDAVDLYGNEVTDAVAKYKLDASGILYELHSPDTEVPRLKPPKT
jgi:hypothetical protein